MGVLECSGSRSDPDSGRKTKSSYSHNLWGGGNDKRRHRKGGSPVPGRNLGRANVRHDGGAGMLQALGYGLLGIKTEPQFHLEQRDWKRFAGLKLPM